MEQCNMYAVILSLTVAVCYYNSLECGFVFDDIPAVVKNTDLRPHIPLHNLFWNDFWGTPMHEESSHKSYRPLCVLSFRLNYAFHELEPLGYHLVNVVLHAAVCVILLRVYSMFVSKTTSFIAALLFAVHPVHSEAVTGVVGRAEMLSAIFYLSALLTYARCTGKKAQTDWSWLVLTVGLVTIAMLCKEVGITVIGVCCVYEVFIAQEMILSEELDRLQNWIRGKSIVHTWFKQVVLRALFLVGSTALLLFVRVRVMGAKLPTFLRFDNPASAAPAPSRHFTFNYLLPINFWLLLFPSELCCDWGMDTIPLITSIIDVRNLATVVFYASLLLFVKYCLFGRGRRNRALIMCITLMVLPFVPASNLFFPVGFVVAERILYTPSMGFCLLVALGYEILMENKKELRYIVWFGLIFVMLTHSLKTVMRNKDWKSRQSIFQAALRVNKHNAKLWNNVGNMLGEDEKHDQALQYFFKAASVQPDDIGTHMNIGRTYQTMNLTVEAEKAYRDALNLFPSFKPGEDHPAYIVPNQLNVFFNLAILISENRSRLLEADQLYQSALSMRNDFWKAYINRGGLLVELGRLEEARQNYEAALTYQPDNVEAHYNLGVVKIKQGKKEAALNHFNTALTHEPNNKHAVIFRTALLLDKLEETGLGSTANESLKKLQEKNPIEPERVFNLALYTLNDKWFNEAELLLKLVIRLEFNSEKALFTLAQMLKTHLNRAAEAVTYLESLLQLDPNHVEGLYLLGQIHLKTTQDLAAAEKSYLRILEFEPENYKALYNLHVVYGEMKDYRKAQECLVKAVKLAPHLEQEQKVQTNLRILEYANSDDEN